MSKIHFHRRNLPHLYTDEGIYFITFRLADSIPSDKVAEIKQANDKDIDIDDEKFERLLIKYDKILDSGLNGNKHLTNPEVAGIRQYILNYKVQLFIISN